MCHIFRTSIDLFDPIDPIDPIDSMIDPYKLSKHKKSIILAPEQDRMVLRPFLTCSFFEHVNDDHFMKTMKKTIRFLRISTLSDC